MLFLKGRSLLQEHTSWSLPSIYLVSAEIDRGKDFLQKYLAEGYHEGTSPG